ncbi:MAG: tetratricopeptide repeat protein [Sedimentisphaerales bacterium]
MASSEIFIGRKDELREFKKAFEDPRGQAIIVVGNRGMGKTWLVNRMAKLASEHPTLKCGFVRYEVTPTDNPDSTMATMMDNAFEAANTEPGSFDNIPERKRQWLALFKTFVPKGDQLIELVASLRRDQTKDIRKQFLERLELISKRMPPNGRAIFIIDPEKYMAKDSDQTWAIVVKNLPEKIKFIFAQRTEDALVGSEVIEGLDNVFRIPGEKLETLSEEEVDELVNCRRENLKVEISNLRKVLGRYKGHPYAVGAALDLVETGTKLEELLQTGKPTELAAKQWEKICEKDDKAIKFFETYAILEVAVPDDVVEYVSEIEATTRKRLQNDKYLRGLLRDESGGRRVYHSILADYILGQMSGKEQKEYHKRAVEVYRWKLRRAKEEQTKPDELAAVRLVEHVLVAEGQEEFVNAFINECAGPLRKLGLLNEADSFSERALGFVKKGSNEQATVLDNLGLIYEMRGVLDKAEEMHKKSLDIAERIGSKEIIAKSYNNLGLIYQDKGELDKAEEMHKKSLEIEKNLGRLEEMAKDYGNLGLVYQDRGDLDKAEEMHKKSLEISEKLGLKEEISNDYGNLGSIYFMRRELDKAEEMHKKSLEIDEMLGLKEGMAVDYENLGEVYYERSDFNKAEEMFKKGLLIDKKLGRLEGMASKESNLGRIYQQRRDLGKAKEYWEKALDLYKKIGMAPEVKKVEGWLKELRI